MRLYHERAEHRSGALAASDEEECFTAQGRRQGVYLTSELMEGDNVLSAEVDDAEALPYEVTGDDEHRLYVVPVAVAAGWGFA